jgi:hypothetical protein
MDTQGLSMQTNIRRDLSGLKIGKSALIQYFHDI